jgi:membrane protease YdiL (CAAX protease family)
LKNETSQIQENPIVVEPPPIQEELEEESGSPGGDNTGKTRRLKIYLWAILWAVSPPVFLAFLLYSVLKPAIRGKEPNGIGYVLWVLGLILLSSIFMLPFGSMETISEALQSPGICRSMLSVDIFVSIATVVLILLTFRKKGIPNTFVPIRRFTVDKKISLLWLSSLLPLTALLLPTSGVLDPKEIIHPLMIAFVNSLKTGAYGAVLMGFISFVILAPILKEIIFRGLLVEESHHQTRKKAVRYLLDLLVCVFFATLHLPVAFLIPFMLAAAFIYVRRRTGSVLPSMIMHASWNFCVLVPVFRSYP